MSNLNEWWIKYAQPLLTWDTFTERGWRTAVTIISHRPPSNLLQKEEYKAIGGWATITEGSVGIHWHSTRRCWMPHNSISMRDDKPMNLLANLFGEKVWLIRGIERHVAPRGLRAITCLRIIRPWIIGRKEAPTDFLIQHGFTPSQQTAKEFIQKFGLKYKTRQIPIETGGEEILRPTTVIEVEKDV